MFPWCFHNNVWQHFVRQLQDMGEPLCHWGSALTLGKESHCRKEARSAEDLLIAALVHRCNACTDFRWVVVGHLWFMDWHLGVLLILQLVIVLDMGKNVCIIMSYNRWTPSKLEELPVLGKKAHKGHRVSSWTSIFDAKAFKVALLCAEDKPHFIFC